jgi:type 1 glutamine amidotransferase
MCKCSEGVTRRQAMQAVAAMAAAFAAGSLPMGWTRAADGKTRKVLFFTKSSGFQHDVVKRAKPDELSFAEKALVDLGKQHGFEVTATKDGSVFTPEKLAEFDVIAFYTTGDLDKPDSDPKKTTPKDASIPMPPGGAEALLKFIESGKGFVGFHCATDTFNKHGDGVDSHPYIKMVGGEFNGHGSQQPAKIRAVGGFAPLKDVKDFEMTEEWYAFKNIAPDMHVILVQETDGMKEDLYTKRKAYPETWTRTQGKGRVFYTSMGHREDVWTNPLFQQVFLAGLSWAAGNIQAETRPNLMEACPGVENVRPA